MGEGRTDGIAYLIVKKNTSMNSGFHTFKLLMMMTHTINQSTNQSAVRLFPAAIHGCLSLAYLDQGGGVIRALDPGNVSDAILLRQDATKRGFANVLLVAVCMDVNRGTDIM